MLTPPAAHLIYEGPHPATRPRRADALEGQGLARDTPGGRGHLPALHWQGGQPLRLQQDVGDTRGSQWRRARWYNIVKNSRALCYTLPPISRHIATHIAEHIATHCDTKFVHTLPQTLRHTRPYGHTISTKKNAHASTSGNFGTGRCPRRGRSDQSPGTSCSTAGRGAGNRSSRTA